MDPMVVKGISGRINSKCRSSIFDIANSNKYTLYLLCQLDHRSSRQILSKCQIIQLTLDRYRPLLQPLMSTTKMQQQN